MEIDRNESVRVTKQHFTYKKIYTLPIFLIFHIAYFSNYFWGVIHLISVTYFLKSMYSQYLGRTILVMHLYLFKLKVCSHDSERLAINP